MPKGSWLILIAIGGLISAGAPKDAEPTGSAAVVLNGNVLECDDYGCKPTLEEPPDNHKSEKQCEPCDSGSGNERAANEGGSYYGTKVFGSVTNTPPASLPTEQEQQRSDEDLSAQKAMAFWAMMMFIATISGVLLIARTLQETVKAADFAAQTLTEAKAATQAAIDTVEVTRETGIVQAQAYVVTNGGEFWPKADATDRLPASFSFKIFLENKGNSPAREIEIIDAEIHFMRAELGEEGGFSGRSITMCSRRNETGFSANIGPGGREHALLWIEVTGNEPVNITSHFFHVTITGKIVWKNEFKKPQSEEFAVASEVIYFSAFRDSGGFIDSEKMVELYNVGRKSA